MAVLRATVRGHFNSVDAADNVFTFDYDNSIEVVDDDLLDYMGRFYNSTLLSALSPRWSCNTISVEQPTTDGHWIFVKDLPFVKVGSNDQDMLPQQTAGLIVGITASRRRGKKFVPGLCEESNDGGMVTNPALAALILSAGEYVAASAVEHVLTPGVCLPNGDAFIAFNSYRVATVFSSQRRRKQGVGS